MTARTTAGHLGLEVLDEHECFTLLGRTHLGRMGLIMGALPAVLPVHFALLGRDPVFRTEAGAKLAAATAGSVVCLEVDSVDTESHAGWSVLVTGPADLILDPEERARAELLPLRPWVGQGDSFVRIRASLVSGRRISSPAGKRP